jgi:hypothetical protein
MTESPSRPSIITPGKPNWEKSKEINGLAVPVDTRERP